MGRARARDPRVGAARGAARRARRPRRDRALLGDSRPARPRPPAVALEVGAGQAAAVGRADARAPASREVETAPRPAGHRAGRGRRGDERDRLDRARRRRRGARRARALRSPRAASRSSPPTASTGSPATRSTRRRSSASTRSRAATTASPRRSCTSRRWRCASWSPSLGPRTREAVAALLPGPVTLVVANPERRYPLACREDPERLGVRLIDGPAGRRDVPDLPDQRQPQRRAGAGALRRGPGARSSRRPTSRSTAAS